MMSQGRGKWQGWRDSNSQPSVLETAVLPIGTTPLQQVKHYTHGSKKVKWNLQNNVCLLEYSTNHHFLERYHCFRAL